MQTEYRQVEDYLIPNIVLSDPPDVDALSVYGMMRKHFLKTNHPAHYGLMLVLEKLYPHCQEVQQQAVERFDILMEYFVTSNPPPQKELDGMAWASHMSMLKRAADEVVATEIIYSFPENISSKQHKKYPMLRLLK